MATIIRNIELFSNQKNANDLKNALEQYIENYLGHVVKNYDEADKWFDEVFGKDRQCTHSGDSQYAHITLNADDTPVRIVIEEVVSDSGADDYCYIVTVTED